MNLGSSKSKYQSLDLIPLDLDSSRCKNIFIEDYSLKILDDIAWFKGKSLSFIYILTSGEVCAYLVLSLSTRGRLLGIIFELIRQNI